MKKDVPQIIENRMQKRAKRTHKKLKRAALDIFGEQSIGAATIEGITQKADIGMDKSEIDKNIKPIRKVFVGSLCSFLGRKTDFCES